VAHAFSAMPLSFRVNQGQQEHSMRVMFWI
jgi:hypothetical protein